jgi:hypothetical protein
MKTIKYINIATICAVIMLSSCNKDGANMNSINEVDLTTQKLIEFKNKLNSKDGSFLSLEDATWNLEGLLNYENANNHHDMKDIIHQYDTLVYNFQSLKISFSELGVIYSDLNHRLDQHLQLNPHSTFDLIDLETVQSYNQVEIIMISAIGQPNTKLQYNPFISTDYWRWGWSLGKCDGTLVGSDAAQQLKVRFNNPVGSFVSGYYTNVEMKSVHPINYPDPNSPSTYMMFLASGIGEYPQANPPCISPNDLNYYLGKFDYIKDLNCPSGKKFRNSNVLSGTGTGTNNWNVYHSYELYYGKFTSGSSGN